MIGHSFRTLEELPYIPTMQNNRTSSRTNWSLLSFSRRFALAVAAGTALVTVALAQAQAPGDPSRAQGGGAAPAGAGGATVPQTAAAAKSEEPPTEAERVIDAAIKKLAAIQSVSAELVTNVEMLNQKFTINGRYLKAPNKRVYLRLAVAGLPDTSSTTLQVCDGETLWDYQRVLDAQYYRKMSIKPVMERLDSPDLDPSIKEKATNQMGFSGPETLLVGLRKMIKFDQKEEGEFAGKKVWVLHGVWKSRQGLVLPNAQPVPATGPLPYYVPSLATLYLGKDDSWPYKMLLLGRVPTDLLDTRRRGPDGRPQGALRSIERPAPTRIELIYSDVKLNVTIRVDEFAFQAPPAANVDDNTETVVTTLDKAIQMEQQRKKSEATRKDGAMIEPIDIPSTPIEKTPKGAEP
jgi:outer membrane lipoprotein-sorting protein